jgi:hypothetical protein
MLEAWLLSDQMALRNAAGNPSGTVPLPLPEISRIEYIPDPKEQLFEILRIASDLPPGRRRRLNVRERIHRVAELVDDFSPLRKIAAFNRLEQDVIALLKRIA